MVRTIRYIAERDLKLLQQQCEALIRSWVDEWFLDSSMFSINSVTRIESDDKTSCFGSVWTFRVDDEHWCALSIEGDGASLFSSMVSNAVGDMDFMQTQLGGYLVTHAVTDLLSKVAMGVSAEHVGKDLASPEPQWPEAIRGLGVGAVNLTGVLGNKRWRLILSHGCMEQHVADIRSPLHHEDAPLTGIQHCLGKENVRGHIDLVTEELSLEELVSLQVGDVLTLDQSINESVSFALENGQTGLSGFIGKKMGKRALYVRDKL